MSIWRRRLILALALGATAIVAAAVLRDARRARSDGGRARAGGSTITGWLSNALPAGWSSASDRIIVNRRGAGGLWDAYSVPPDGRGEACITCRRPWFRRVGAATNRGASDLSPNGRYVLLVVEKGSHPGRIGEAQTAPGVGVFDDIWLATVDGAHAWRLTDIPASAADGIIWPRFDRSGNRIVWAQMYAGADLSHPLGAWAMKVARLSWHAGVPALVDVRTYEPRRGRFFEPYGFSPDDRRIIFASDIGVAGGLLSPPAFNLQIWTIDAARLDGLERVTPPYRLHGPFSDYNEFAYFLPAARSRILVARTFEATAHGMDYWTMDAGGGDARRLTYMNQRGSGQYLGYSLAGGVAFDPRDPHRFVAGISHDLSGRNVQAVFVTLP